MPQPEEAQRLIEEHIATLGEQAKPGSRAGEVASRVGTNPNHAQTILANLVKQGVATKEGREYSVSAGKA